jgi:hypothetical protein
MFWRFCPCLFFLHPSYRIRREFEQSKRRRAAVHGFLADSS